MIQGWGGFGAGGLIPHHRLPQRFEEQYHCYSVAYADKGHLEGGDKILLPPSAFDTLARLNVDYPMLFQLQSSDKGTLTHCGVLEFTAEEGSVYIPFWMMQNLLIEEGSVISVTNVSLPKATFVKLQPQHVDFLDIHNPRAVLEHALRSYSCVTKGDVICLPYNNKNYHFMLKEVQPQDAACIIETDCNVDFDAPVGYKEPNTNSTDGASLSDANFFANMPKQTASGNRISASSSPTFSSTSGASGALTDKNADYDKNSKAKGIRIENGAVIPPDESESVPAMDASMMAQRTGTTGVQNNAAIPINAPAVNYWAVNAGDGARLDGKKPVALKDEDGSEVDVRKARADAAALRLAAANASKPSFPGDKITDTSVPKRKTKSRTGKKFSKIKQTSGVAFEGTENKL